MSARRYQPAREALRDERWSVSRAAAEIGVDPSHLRCCLMATAAPSPEVRERLPKLLGRPLEDLFDADLLAREYKGPIDNYAPRASS